MGITTKSNKFSSAVSLRGITKGYLSPSKSHLENLEKEWVDNFHKMCSKDNENHPKYRREFFEKPVIYDVNGIRKSSPHPYGWDFASKRDEYNDILLQQKSPKSPSKMSLINSLAFATFMSNNSTFKSLKTLGTPSSNSPQLMAGKTTSYYKDHLMVQI